MEMINNIIVWVGMGFLFIIGIALFGIARRTRNKISLIIGIGFFITYLIWLISTIIIVWRI